MLTSAVELLQERGAAGVTIDAILSRSNAPRGSVYYHFPGGRNQIMTESPGIAGDTITAIINDSAQKGPLATLHTFGRFWTRILRDSDYAAGCPVVAAAVGGSPEDQHLAPLVASIFTNWHEALAQALENEGVDPARAARLARTAVAAVEGAVILARSARSTEPVDDVITELEAVLASVMA
ncbi:TetR/AcrR family transcriptional regulator [Hoyosella sp. G463]|uniref:TetR/AcrR family transcriptional regulator n=2 Tax=Lolliginicoccus lacisalsi TaxID=2742202 RepID=A0A927JBD7_9ACTN|nr:TetR/AcrR family transcriptional regulator [Lolliginicoccus lacisalsi]MBD8505770.1 TetR/AcrR family transcriptional regulator [Lolliginicoccus lacisalsi]